MLPSFFLGFCFFKYCICRCTPILPKVPAILHLVIVGFSSIISSEILGRRRPTVGVPQTSVYVYSLTHSLTKSTDDVVM